MKNLVYYPSFEPTDLSWLKYALIYAEEFSPIIPERGKSSLSDIFRRINENTDLIKIHEPKWWQGDNASTKALKEIDFIFRYPEQYRDKLQSSNILRTWQNPDTWTHRLYEEKFNAPFKYECIKRGLGAESHGDLMTSKELAHFYMTFLAEEVAYEQKSNPVTDVKNLDNLSTFLRTRNVEQSELINAIQTIVNITLPARIQNISIEKLIAFRNDSGIKGLRQNFNKSIEHYYSCIENGTEADGFIKNLEKTNTELAKEIALFFIGTTSATIGGLLLYANSSFLETTKYLLEGTAFALGSTLAVNKAWGENRERKDARKFINKISTLGFSRRSMH